MMDTQTAIRKEIFLAASRERVWQFLTDREKLAAWLMTSDIEAEEGIRFAFTAPPSGQWDGKIFCEVKNVIENERLSYTWNANDIGAETMVTFELADRPGGTQLTLVHSELDKAMPGALGRHAAGWTNCFKALQVALFGPDPAYDWSVLQLTAHIEAPVADVWSMWSTPKGLAAFWADTVVATSFEGVPRPPSGTWQLGDRIDVHFTPGSEARLEINNIEENKLLLFTFGEDYGWVRVTLEDDGGRTKLVLRHFGLQVDDVSQWESHANGRGWWTFILANLKSVLLYGHDLRDRRPETAAALSPVYRPDGTEETGPHDWSAFDIWLWVDAAPSEVARRWQTREGLESFFIKSVDVTGEAGQHRKNEERFHGGDHYAWRWIHDYGLEGDILAANDNSLRFTFGGGMEVEITCHPSGNGTLLQLHQSGMADTPDDRVQSSLNCRCCWIYYLASLKSQCEYGIDLRDHNPVTADGTSVGYNRG